MPARGLLSEPASVRFQLLDPLRGIAALWVFTFHYGFSQQLVSSFPWIQPIASAGHLGVPMFFVISGYCMMASIRAARRHGESVRSFLRRRSLRIYPPYWFSLLIVAALPFVIEGLSETLISVS
jgi:peptidoglycan/LPS O-acetylase OafA/YrhL